MIVQINCTQYTTTMNNNSILNSSRYSERGLYRDIIILYKLLGLIIKYFIKIVDCMFTTLYYYIGYYTDFLVTP